MTLTFVYLVEKSSLANSYLKLLHIYFLGKMMKRTFFDEMNFFDEITNTIVIYLRKTFSPDD
jgi:hypothetical protein